MTPPRALRLAVTLVLALLAIAGCTAPADGPPPVRLGAGSTAEEQLLAALAAEVLQRRDIGVEVVSELGDTAAVRDAGLRGEVDAYFGYSGATWTLALGMSAPPADPRESFEAVAAEDAKDGLQWIGPTAVDAALRLFVHPDRAPADGEATTTWLAGQLGQRGAAVCADPAFLDAPGGWAYLTDTYAIATDLVTTVRADAAAAVTAVADGRCLAGLAPATSGAASAAGLVALADDQGVFPAMVAAPVVVGDGRADQPAVRQGLVDLAERLSTAGVAAMNARIEAGELIDEVAAEHVEQLALGGG